MKCPKCGQATAPDYFYCPYCGRNLKEKPVGTDTESLIKLMLLSALLAPWGLGTTIKYIRSPDSQARMAGFVSLALTIGVLVGLTIWSSFLISKLTEELNTQMGALNGLY